MALKLITEIYDDPLSLITEADAKGVKHLYIQGPFAVAGVKNRNGRVYHPDLMEKVVDKYNNDYIKTNRALGECNHPQRLSVDYERATHLVTEMKNDGSGVYIGKAKILKTPMGKLIEGLLESGVAIGVSTRGAGTIIESGGTKTVGDDFLMTAVDVVSDPSALVQGKDGSFSGAFVQGILEGVEFVMNDSGILVQQEITKIIHEDYNKKRLTEERKLELFNKFIQEISRK